MERLKAMFFAVAVTIVTTLVTYFVLTTFFPLP